MRSIFLIVLSSLIALLLVAGCTTDTGLHGTPRNFTTPEYAQTVGQTIEGSTPAEPASTTGGNTVDANATAQEGDTVWVNYTGSLQENGKVFDSSVREDAVQAGLPLRPSYEPLQVKLGAGQVIQGFDEGLVGMEVGEFKVLVIPPDKGYGEKNPDKIQKVSWNQFAGKPEDLNIGKIIQTSRGAAVVVAKDNNAVTLDFNPELAGKTLIFKVTMTKIQRG